MAQRGESQEHRCKVDKDNTGTSLGTYLRVLAELGLNGDIKQLTADDKVGRKLRDLALMR